MRALGIDPSLSCTGWAVVNHEGGTWSLDAAGTVVADPGGDLWPRVRRACTELEKEVDSHRMCDWSIDLVAVEMPMTQMFTSQRRSATSLPGYGVMCGAVAMMAEGWSRCKGRSIFPSATTWAIGLPRAKKGQKGKGDRILAAEVIFGAIRMNSHAKREAVADAALLARWAILQEGR